MNRCFAELIDLLLPRRCLHCAERVRAPGSHQYLCSGCGSRLVIAGPVNAPLPVHAALVLEGPARTLLHALKYRGRTGVGAMLAGHMARALAAASLPGCWLIPVPLHPLRRWRRGYDQAVVLARAIAAVVPGATPLMALRRRRHTLPQVGLDGAARRRNLVGAFQIAAPLHRLRRWPCVLIDDVVTTGATLEEAARALRRHGVQPIAALVAATAASNLPSADAGAVSGAGTLAAQPGNGLPSGPRRRLAIPAVEEAAVEFGA